MAGDTASRPPQLSMKTLLVIQSAVCVLLAMSTSPLATGDNVDGACLPPVLVPSEPAAPDKACEQEEIRARVRAAVDELPWRERKVIGAASHRRAGSTGFG